MLTAQSRQKSYTNKQQRELEFEASDQVFVKVSPIKGVMQFRKKEKLNPRFIERFEVTESVSPVAYRVSLPSDLAGVHDVFHVSILRKYVHDPLHVVSYIPLLIKGNLTYDEVLVHNLDRKEQELRTKRFSLFKILW
jgi:hypothetical protein